MGRASNNDIELGEAQHCRENSIGQLEEQLNELYEKLNEHASNSNSIHGHGEKRIVKLEEQVNDLKEENAQLKKQVNDLKEENEQQKYVPIPKLMLLETRV